MNRVLTPSPAATSINVERLFSCGHLVLSHIQNRLSVQSTHAILCLRSWSQAGFVKSDDEQKVAQSDDIDGDASDYKMDEGWDNI